MLLNPNKSYLGNVSFGNNNFLDNVARRIRRKSVGPSGDYDYSFFPSNSFGQQHVIPGDFKYNLYPFPAPNMLENEKLSMSFGKKKRKSRKKTTKSSKRKFVGYVVRRNKRIVKVYSQKTKTGKTKKVMSNGKLIRSKKIYKTKTKAKASIKK